MSMDEDETWVAYPKYEGTYEVSSHGVFRSLTRMIKHKRATVTNGTRVVNGKVLKPYLGTHGYLEVYLCGNGRRENVLVHRGVLEAFIGPCPDGMQCRHKDGDKMNNRLDNLAWGTPLENAADMKLHGHGPVGERHGMAKITENDVREIRASNEKQRVLAKRYGVLQATISSIRKKKLWKHVV